MNTPKTETGVLESIATRPTKGDAMAERRECELQPGQGLTGDDRPSGPREVTLLSAEAWAATCAELSTDLPWQLRRANLLVRVVDLQAAGGKRITIGEVTLLVGGETRPCALMDAQFTGLRDALRPDKRGGVFAKVLIGGRIKVGDIVRILP